MGQPLAIVLLQLTMGGFASLAAVPSCFVGDWFHRLTGLLYIGIYSGAAALAWNALGPDVGLSAWSLALGALMLAYVGCSWFGAQVFARWVAVVTIPVGLALSWNLAAILGRQYGVAGVRLAILAVHSALSAAALGLAMTSMLFGHWYLSAPGLSTEPLRRLCYAMAGAVVGASVLVVLAVRLSWSTLVSFGMDTLDSFGGVFLWARLLIGVCAVGVAVGFVVFCIREGSTQAATGFLYLVVVFMLMGELLGRFLLGQTRLTM